MKKRSVSLFLNDILLFFSRIQKYTKNLDFKSFESNQLIVDAVLRNLELIGEAAKNIPKEIRKDFDDIPWSEMIGLRNIAAHGYFKMDLSIIWNIVKKEIPETKPKFVSLISEIDLEDSFG